MKEKGDTLMVHAANGKQAGFKALTGIAAVLALVLYGADNGFAEEAATALETTVNQVAQSAQDKTPESQPAEGRYNWKKEWRQKFLENHPKWKERLDINSDGQINRQELKQGRQFRKMRQHERQHRDYDNNPPGRRGGPGTNWENRPGPQGGPGASPDRRPFGKKCQGGRNRAQ